MAAPLLATWAATGDGGTVLTLVGELDLSTKAVFLGAVDEAVRTGAGSLTIDTGDLLFADSSAIHALIQARATANAHDMRLQLMNVSGSLERTLDLAGINDLFEIVGH